MVCPLQGMNGPATIYLIRHAEKPLQGEIALGVDEAGAVDPQNLSVRGWQRAGALAVCFGGALFGAAGMGDRPQHLLAAGPRPRHPSRRCVSTLLPLSRRLPLPVGVDFGIGDEAALARHIGGLQGSVLVAWSHERLPVLAACLAPSGTALPVSWPDDRFDLVWMFLRAAHGGPETRRFMQLPQRLLEGDRADLLELPQPAVQDRGMPARNPTPTDLRSPVPVQGLRR